MRAGAVLRGGILALLVLLTAGCGGPSFFRRTLLILPEARFAAETPEQALTHALAGRGFAVVQPFGASDREDEMIVVRRGAESPARLTITRRARYAENAPTGRGRREGTYRIYRTGPGIQYSIAAVSIGPDGNTLPPADDVVLAVRIAIAALQGPGTPQPEEYAEFAEHGSAFSQDVLVPSSGSHPQEEERVFIELQRLGYTTVRPFQQNVLMAWRPAEDGAVVRLYVLVLDAGVNGTRFEVGVRRRQDGETVAPQARDITDVGAIVSALEGWPDTER